MTARNLFNTALALTGRDIYDEYIEDNDSLQRRAHFLINQVLWEFSLPDIESLSSVLNLTPKLFEAVSYGVARLIAADACDILKYNELTEIYNLKRSSALGNITRVKNTIPV